LIVVYYKRLFPANCVYAVVAPPGFNYCLAMSVIALFPDEKRLPFLKLKVKVFLLVIFVL
jgi:hypothetical protein